jgi:O-antigen ligase
VSGFYCCYNGKVKYSVYLIWGISFLALAVLPITYIPSQSSGEIYKLFTSFVLTACIIQGVYDYSDIDKIMKYFLTAAFGVSVISLLFYSDMLLSGERFGGEIVGNANSLMVLMIFPVNILIYHCFENKNKHRLLYLCMLTICMTVLLFTGSKKGLFIPLIFVVLYMLLSKKGKKFRTLLTIVIIMCLLYYIIFNVPEIYTVIGIRIEELFATYFGTGQSTSQSDLIRIMMIEDGYKMFLDSPIWGHGINAFAVISGYGSYSHNNYVEILTALGLIGFIFYYSIYAYCLITLFRLRKFMEKDIGMCSFFIAMLLCSMIFDWGGVTYNLFMNFISIGLTVCYIQIAKQEILTTGASVTIPY